MRQVLLCLGALALICVAGYVMAQAPEQNQPTTPDRTPHATPSPSPTMSTTGQEEDRGTQLRLSRMDTSMAAFRKLDTDHDGRISALEAADSPKVAAAFTMADKDKDGYLSQEEFAAISATNPHSSDVDASSPSGDRPAQSPQE